MESLYLQNWYLYACVNRCIYTPSLDFSSWGRNCVIRQRNGLLVGVMSCHGFCVWNVIRGEVGVSRPYDEVHLFIFIINVDVRASLCAPRLIPRALKLTIM
jgi:hypothetical protein